METKQMTQLKKYAKTALIVLTACTATFATTTAIAQVKRVVGPDGRVTYSDARTAASSGQSVNESQSASGVPYEVSKIAQKYPVVLYTSNNCQPCTDGRTLLTQRGIPFTEKTINTNADIDAYKKIMGDDSLPAMTVGAQQLKGFNSSEWTQYLNIAGYPEKSKLGSAYRRPPASPLAARVSPARVQAGSNNNDSNTGNTTSTTPITPPVTENNPTGIRF